MLNLNIDKIKYYQVLSGKSIKIIACVTMLVDHFSKSVLSYILNNVWFPMTIAGAMPYNHYIKIDNFIRFTLFGVGSMAFPLYCFLITEGYTHTQNKTRYIGRMFFFALLSELPVDICFFSDYSISENTFPFYWKYQNVFFTYTIALACLCSLEKIKTHSRHITAIKKQLFQYFSGAFCVLSAFFIAEFIKSDYGGSGVLFIIAFYVFRRRRIYQIMAFLLTYIVLTGNQPTIFIMCANFVIFLYNGKKGKYNKYFFYLFYPVHIMILYLITIALGMVK